MLNEPGNTAVIVTSVIGFLALLVQQAVALFIQHRNHRWDMEERDRRAVEMARQMTIQHQALGTKLDANTALTRVASAKLDANTELTQEAKDQAIEAFREANNTNLKIASLGIALKTATEEVVSELKENQKAHPDV